MTQRKVTMRRHGLDQHATMGARNGCGSGKVSFVSKAAVKRHIKRGNRQSYGERAYRCERCGNWHITTTEMRHEA
jgi:hypothetical protein